MDVGMRRPEGLGQNELLEWALINRTAWDGQCLLWQGSSDKHGYAQLRTTSGLVYVSRLILADQLGLPLGALPRATYALHSCDRGPEGCVTPWHIRPGTHSDNMREAVERGKNGMLKKETCPRGHRLSGANLRPTSARSGKRGCLTCQRALAATAYAVSRGRTLAVQEAEQEFWRRRPDVAADA